jgi:hypothetical protein
MPRPDSRPVSFRAAPELVSAARQRADREGSSWPAAMRSLLYDYAVGRCGLDPDTLSQLQHDLAELAALVRRVHAAVLSRSPPRPPLADCGLASAP